MSAPSPSDQQRALAALTRLTTHDLTTIWGKLNLTRPDQLADPLSMVLEQLALRYGLAAASLSADWYDESRDEAQAPGSFTAITADIPETTRFEAMARWGVGPLFGADPNSAAALQNLSGGMSRVVMNAGRDTTSGSVQRDPAKPKFARHASANACAFCAMLATRGAVYHSGETATGYHDHCHCIAVPVWPGQEHGEAPYVQNWRDVYNASGSTDSTDALAYMRKNGDFKDSPKPETQTGGSDSGGGRPPPTGFAPPPDPGDKPAWEAYWSKRREALGINYGHDTHEIRPPEIQTAERLLALGGHLEHVPTDHSAWISTSDYFWTPPGSSTRHLVEIKSLQDDTVLHRATFPMRIKKSVGKSREHGRAARKRDFIVDAGDREVPSDVLAALRSFNRDNPGYEIHRLWLLSKGSIRQIPLA